MKVYTYSVARQRLSEVLDIARTEEVIIKRRGVENFSIILKKTPKSPFDIRGIKTRATTNDILDAVRESRSRTAERIRLDCESEANHNLNRLLDKPGLLYRK